MSAPYPFIVNPLDERIRRLRAMAVRWR